MGLQLKEENYQFFSMYFQKKILAMNDMVLETESCILQIGTEFKNEFRDGNNAKKKKTITIEYN